MDLTIYDIIRGPVISDKAYRLNKGRNQLVLNVHVNANKILIKNALEQLFDVKVKDVRVLIRKDSTLRAAAKRYNARPTVRKKKIAYVTLKEGYTLNLFGSAEAASAAENNS